MIILLQVISKRWNKEGNLSHLFVDSTLLHAFHLMSISGTASKRLMSRI